MRRPAILVIAFIAAVPSLAAAAPCTVGSLTEYVALGDAGCTVGGATLSGFTAGPSLAGGTALNPATVVVTPFSLGVDFGIDARADANEITGALIHYLFGGPAIDTIRLSLSGSSASAAASPDDTGGVVTAIGQTCAGATLTGSGPGDPGFSCPTPVDLVVLHDALGAIALDQATFGPASFFDVFVDISLDGGTGGTASLAGPVRTTFVEPIPEPSLLVLMSAGLLGGFARRRRGL
jgi:hypothetical protein